MKIWRMIWLGQSASQSLTSLILSHVEFRLEILNAASNYWEAASSKRLNLFVCRRYVAATLRVFQDRRLPSKRIEYDGISFCE